MNISQLDEELLRYFAEELEEYGNIKMIKERGMKKMKFKWESTQQQYFEKMKHINVNDSVQVYPHTKLPFKVNTDGRDS